MKRLLIVTLLAMLHGLAVQAEAPPVREIQIVVDKGYTPGSIEVAAGEAVRLKVVRKEYTPCTKDIVFPSLGITRELPVNQVVTIDIPGQPSGEVPFRCGMNMVRGSLVFK